jgi:hypothetical protein
MLQTRTGPRADLADFSEIRDRPAARRLLSTRRETIGGFVSALPGGMRSMRSTPCVLGVPGV